MNESQVRKVRITMEHKYITEDSEVRLYMSEVREKRKGITEAIEKALVFILKIVYAFSISRVVAEWSINYAYAERGYKAYGSEYLLIALTFCLMYWAISKFFTYYKYRRI